MPRRQLLGKRDPQQARKAREVVRSPVTRTERERVEGEREGERESVTSNQRPSKDVATPESRISRLTEQIEALNIL